MTRETPGINENENDGVLSETEIEAIRSHLRQMGDAGLRSALLALTQKTAGN
ncbi:MAG TPA: hypothetical protein VF281_01035 [Candidatus Saccharimonadales bacterium]